MLTPVAATALSAVLFWFGTGLHPYGWLTWIAALPVLLAARNTTGWVAWSMAFAAWTIGACNETYYLHSVLHLPLWLVILSPVGGALVFAFAVRLWQRLFRRGLALRAGVAFAGIWVIYEFIRYTVSVHSSFDHLAYSQADLPLVIQLGAVTGLTGIAFAVLVCQGLLATLDRKAAIAAACTLVVVLGWGAVREKRDRTAPEIQAAMVTSDLTRIPKLELLSRYAGESQKLISQGAQLVVLPEKIKVVQDLDVPAIDALFQSASKGSVIVVGLERWTSRDKRNESRIYVNGNPPLLYEKQHMLPPFEDHLLVGTRRVVLRQPSGIWGMAICKDMTFPSFGRAYGQDGAGLMAVPAWDFGIDGAYGDRLALMRGVENGYSVLRAPRDGRLIATTNHGHVLIEKASNSAPFVTAMFKIPVQHIDTTYTRWGDWFAWVTFAASAWALWGLRRVVRRKPDHSTPAPVLSAR